MTVRPHVSKALVYAACEDMMRSGIWVTNAAVHAHLGHGSMVTVNKYVRAWTAEYVVRINANSETADQNLPQRFIDAAQALYKISVEDARDAMEQDYAARNFALDEERARVEKIRVEALADVADAQRAVNSYREANRVYKQLVDSEFAKVRALEQTLRDRESDLALVRQEKDQQAIALQQAHRELSECIGTLKARDEELARLRADLADQTQRANRAVAEMAELVRGDHGQRRPGQKPEGSNGM